MSNWEHYRDLPYEVVIEKLGPSGEVLDRELVRRHSLLSEAQHTLAANQRSLAYSKHYRAVLDILEYV